MPAARTYEPLATTTVAGSSTTQISFSSFSGYTDLILISSASGSQDAVIEARFNNDSGTNYSYTYVYGSGSTAASGRNSTATFVRAGRTGTVSTSFCPNILHIQDYSNTTTYKTVLERENDALASVLESVGLWRSTSAITSILLTISGGNFTAGSTFTLYGIKAA